MTTSKDKYPPNDDADNPIYRTNEFRMYCLKVLPCSKRYCHDWTTCPFAHAAEKAKRRDPRVYNYTGVACPEMKKNQTCPRGDQCPYAHNVFEYWLHHSRYRTQLCNDGAGCKRKICFFAHTLEELRVSSVKVQVPEGSRSDSSSGCINPFAPSPRSSRHGSGNNNHNSHAASAAVAADKGGPLVSASSSPASLLNMPHLQEGYGSLPEQLSAAGSGSLQDQLALEQLMRLVALTQQQQHMPAQQQQQPDMQQLLAAQMLMAQHQQQAAVAAAQQQQAVLQAQQQMAALQLLSQMNMAPGMEQYAAAMAQYGSAYPAAAAAMQQQQQQQQVAAAAMAAALSSMGAGGAAPSCPPQGNRPPNMMSALTAALGATSSQDGRSCGQPVDELTRQLSGLSTSSQVAMSPMGHHLAASLQDTDPASARSYGSAYGQPSMPGRRGGSQPQRMSTSHSLQGHDSMPLPHEAAPQHMSSLMSMPPAPQHAAPPAGAGAGHKVGGIGPVGPRGASAPQPVGALGLNTSPISISALADGYTTTATGNSYFSISHSLGSSHDGSDLEALHQ